MATYKIIQNIEAEDKFVGPLTLRQFVFACIGALFIWLNVLALGRGAWLVVPFLLPPMLFFFFLAVPWSRDQPTEMWVLARLRFLFMPRRKIWDQSNVEELVTITAPKKEEEPTKGFEEGEARSRLKALTQVLDSHGWAIKHASLDEGQQEIRLPGSDRLVNPSSQDNLTPIEPAAEQAEDVYDTATTRYEDITKKIEDNKQAQRKRLEESVRLARKNQNQPPAASAQNTQKNISLGTSSKAAPSNYSQQPADTAGAPAGRQPASQENAMDEQLLLETLKKKQQDNRLATRKLHSIGAKVRRPQQARQASPEAAINTRAAADIMRLAGNDDRSVESIAREAKQSSGKDSGEVRASFH